MTERALLLSTLRRSADDLFAKGENILACRALEFLGVLLDRREISISALRLITLYSERAKA